MEIPKILQSSQNPENVSLTYKGLLLMAIMGVLNYYGITVDQNLIIDSLNALIIAGSALVTLFGLSRRIYNTYK